MRNTYNNDDGDDDNDSNIDAAVIPILNFSFCETYKPKLYTH